MFKSATGNLGTTTAAAGNTVVVSGLGFQPKAVIFWSSGRTETIDTTGSDDIQATFGFATSTTSRASSSFMHRDAVTAAPSVYGLLSDASAFSVLTTSGAVDGLMDLQSFDSDGFTLVIDDAFASSYRISYLALGGTTLTNATTGTFQEPVATGTQDITSVGFQPDAVIIIGSSGVTIGTPRADGNHTIGMAAGASLGSFVASVYSRDTDPIRGAKYSKSGEVINGTDPASVSASSSNAAITAWLSNGFTLNWANTDGAGTRDLAYLALKGGSYAVGNLLTQTDTTTPIVVSNLKFRPAAALLVSVCRAEATTDIFNANIDLSIGAFSALGERTSQGMFSEEGVSPAESSTSLEQDAVYTNISTADAVEALMDIQSINNDGFTCIMDDADASQMFVGFLAMGDPPPSFFDSF